MNLSRIGREYLEVEVSTDPEVSGWEASFDGGSTWNAGEQVTSASVPTWRWLLVGPDCPEPEVPGQINYPAGAGTSVRVYLRAIDNPEVLIRKGPKVSLKNPA